MRSVSPDLPATKREAASTPISVINPSSHDPQNPDTAHEMVGWNLARVLFEGYPMPWISVQAGLLIEPPNVRVGSQPEVQREPRNVRFRGYSGSRLAGDRAASRLMPPPGCGRRQRG